jgi:hypothetical protein
MLQPKASKTKAYEHMSNEQTAREKRVSMADDVGLFCRINKKPLSSSHGTVAA